MQTDPLSYGGTPRNVDERIEEMSRQAQKYVVKIKMKALVVKTVAKFLNVLFLQFFSFFSNNVQNKTRIRRDSN